MEDALLVLFSFYSWSTWGLNKLHNFSKVIHAGKGSTGTSPGLSDFCAHTCNLCDVLSPNTPSTVPLSILLKLDFRDYPIRYFHHADKNLHLERIGEFVKVTHQNFPDTSFTFLYIQTLYSLQYLALIPLPPTSQSLSCPAPSSGVSSSSEAHTTFCWQPLLRAST